MLRMSKMTDYGTMILARLKANARPVSAADLSDASGLALPTVSKVLKALTRAGLVSSVRGAAGGYRLTRPATEISAAAILDALEGPVTLTECSDTASRCRFESVCTVASAWQRINHAIRRSLEDVSLADLRDGNPLGFDLSDQGSFARDTRAPTS